MLNQVCLAGTEVLESDFVKFSDLIGGLIHHWWVIPKSFQFKPETFELTNVPANLQCIVVAIMPSSTSVARE